MTSERLTLTKAFARAGQRTVAVKPAITLPWPEGERLGYARIYAAADLGYAGLPYNWVTMPDQYTLRALERRERGPARERPLFAEVSLISSHAPWTPIAAVLDDWDAIGDGAVFSRWADEGDPPEVVWRDPERVRHQYTLALDYVLGVLGSYAARFVDERTLLILVGDHQPAPLITGEGAAPRRADARDQRRPRAARAVPRLGLRRPACGPRRTAPPSAWTLSATGSSPPSAARRDRSPEEQHHAAQSGLISPLSSSTSSWSKPPSISKLLFKPTQSSFC